MNRYNPWESAEEYMYFQAQAARRARIHVFGEPQPRELALLQWHTHRCESWLQEYETAAAYKRAQAEAQAALDAAREASRAKRAAEAEAARAKHKAEGQVVLDCFLHASARAKAKAEVQATVEQPKE